MGRGTAGDTMLHVVCKELDPDGIQRGSNRGQLRENINAITVLGNHLLQARNLTGDTLKAGFELGSALGNHDGTIYPLGVLVNPWVVPDA